MERLTFYQSSKHPSTHSVHLFSTHNSKHSEFCSVAPFHSGRPWKSGLSEATLKKEEMLVFWAWMSLWPSISIEFIDWYYEYMLGRWVHGWVKGPSNYWFQYERVSGATEN